MTLIIKNISFMAILAFLGFFIGAAISVPLVVMAVYIVFVVLFTCASFLHETNNTNTIHVVSETSKGLTIGGELLENVQKASTEEKMERLMPYKLVDKLTHCLNGLEQIQKLDLIALPGMARIVTDARTELKKNVSLVPDWYRTSL